ncbi:immunity 49 family protein [Aromatoleum buckelii]|uniref:Uncharacterized protein n=1 Tax=Aromatoleum buckelii TaxID=200254 RepID=A0ABX1N4Z8_9RHOO|nr:immunity 49 family protein [Aromatoleum buckelii]MCK0509707.1 immunity 49 family protein [Aromatoleum buckelii]
MELVTAHDVNLAQLSATLDDERELLEHKRRYLDAALSVRLLHSALTDARRSVDVIARLSPDSPELPEWCGFIARATAALFTFARRPERAQWRLLDIDRTLSDEVRRESLQASSWLTGFWLAWASRDACSLALLTQVPAALLAADEAFDRPLVQALQGAMTRAAATGERLIEALALADPERVQRTDRDWLLDILVPVFECLTPLIDHDEGRFTAALVKLLELRRDHFSRGRAKGMEGVQHLSEEGVGLVAWSKALGFDVPVASPYLPEALLGLEPPEVVACARCATPAGDGEHACHACGHVAADDELRFGFDEWLGLDRDDCPYCAHPYPLIARTCPVCLAER